MIKQIWGLSCRGPFHIKNKLPNQDYFRCYKNKAYSIAVICDGLGSKKYSHFASRRLSKITIRYFKKVLKLKSLKVINSFINIRNKFIYKIFPFKLVDCDCTMQVIIESKDKILLFKCGDGIIYLKGKEELLICGDENSFTNETYSFGSSNVNNWIVKTIDKIPNVPYKILACTDGISNCIETTKLKEFFSEFIELEKKEMVKIVSENLINVNEDDKTLVVVR